MTAEDTASSRNPAVDILSKFTHLRPQESALGKGSRVGRAKGSHKPNRGGVQECPDTPPTSSRWDALKTWHVEPGATPPKGVASGAEAAGPWRRTRHGGAAPLDVGAEAGSTEGAATESRGRARDTVHAEIQVICDASQVLKQQDFDYRVRQYLHALYGKSGQAGVQKALALIHETTKEKKRDSVRNWPAYLCTLLRARISAGLEDDDATGIDNSSASERVCSAQANSSEDGEESLGRLWPYVWRISFAQAIALGLMCGAILEAYFRIFLKP